MSEPDIDLAEARARSAAARTEFRLALGDVFEWLSPARIKAEAAMAATQQIDGAKAALRQQIGRHPIIAWSALASAAALFAFLVRRPVMGIVKAASDGTRALYHRFRRRKA